MQRIYSQKKIHQQLGYLTNALRQDFKQIEDLQVWRDTRDRGDYLGQQAQHRKLPQDVSWQLAAVGDHWSGRDQYFWLKFTVELGQTTQEATVVHLDLGKTGDGNNSGFEGLVYVNGEQFQAVDSNHQEIFLKQDEFQGDVRILILLWSGLEGGGPKQEQKIELRDVSYGPEKKELRTLYRYLVNIVDLLPELKEDDPLLYSYRKLLQQIFTSITWSDGITAEEVSQANKLIADFIQEHHNEKPNFNVAAIGQTHIDVAWLWRYRHTREKAERSFNTALRLMEQDPDFRFFYSSPQVYQFVQADNPALMKRVQAQIDAGKWEADGATWLEPDTNLPSGEALTRQFLYGMKYFKDQLHVEPTVLWLPDVFGYSYALPQIMLGFGIKNFVTSKIGWNETNRMPHDTFYWLGLDGSRVLTHFITTTERGLNYEQHKVWKYTYNGELTPRVLLTSYREYKDKQINNELLIPYGYGDGGGGSTREMVGNLHAMDRLPGLPHVKSKRVSEFFADLEQNLQVESELVSEWDGELYLEFHRGTYTSQSFVKQQNRRLEFALRNLEILATTALVRNGLKYPQEQITELWQLLLRNQFHDVLPGSSIGEVYQDVHLEYAKAWKKIDQLTQDICQAAPASAAEQFWLVNTNLAATVEPVFVKTPAAGQFLDAKKDVIPAQQVTDGYLLKLAVPGFSSRQVTFTPDRTNVSEKEVHSSSGQVETKHYTVSWNEKGQLTSIYDKDNELEVLTQNSNILKVYEDRPVDFDAWNIDADYVDQGEELAAQEIQVEKNGPQVTLRAHYSYRKSKIAQTVILSDWSRRIDFDTQVDWHEHQTLLRTAFNVNVLADSARYDIQYGSISRPVSNNTSWQEAQFEVVGHKWADLSQRDHGVALLNDSKYGYAVSRNEISLSLLKSGIFPDPEADQGMHHFKYALLPHAGDFITGNVEAEALELNNPVMVSQSAGLVEPLFKFNDEAQVEIDALKLTEDGQNIILRLHDYSGGTQKIRVQPQFEYRLAARVRLDETHAVPVSAVNDAIELAVKPFEIVTLSFERNG